MLGEGARDAAGTFTITLIWQHCFQAGPPACTGPHLRLGWGGSGEEFEEGRPGFLGLPKEASHTEPLSQEVQMGPRTDWETQAAPPQAPVPQPSLPGAPFGGKGSPRAPGRKGGPSPTAATLASLPRA